MRIRVNMYLRNCLAIARLISQALLNTKSNNKHFSFIFVSKVLSIQFLYLYVQPGLYMVSSKKNHCVPNLKY